MGNFLESFRLAVLLNCLKFWIFLFPLNGIQVKPFVEDTKSLTLNHISKHIMLVYPVIGVFKFDHHWLRWESPLSPLLRISFLNEDVTCEIIV